MASFTLERPNVFPNGTTVKAYPATNWPAPGPPGGAPVGSSSAEGSVSSDKVTLSGLTENVSYYAVAEVGGAYRYIGFTISSPAGSEYALKSEVEGKASKGEVEAKASKAEAETKASKTELETEKSGREAAATSGAWSLGLPGVEGTSIPSGIRQGSETLVAAKIYIARFTVPVDMLIKSGSFVVTTASTKDNPVALAIYDATAKKRVAVTASTTGLMTTTGVKNISLVSQVTLKAGTVYYSAFIVKAAEPEAGTVGKVDSVGPSTGAGNEVWGTTPPNKTGGSATGIAIPPPEELAEAPAGTTTAIPLIYWKTT